VQELVSSREPGPDADYGPRARCRAPPRREMLASLTGTKFVHVPFKGTAPALVALSRRPWISRSPSRRDPPVRAGKLRALAVTTARRSALVPEIPTVADPVSRASTCRGPRDLSPAERRRTFVAKINASINRALRSRRCANGLMRKASSRARTPEEFGAFSLSEVESTRKSSGTGVRID